MTNTGLAGDRLELAMPLMTESIRTSLAPTQVAERLRAHCVEKKRLTQPGLGDREYNPVMDIHFIDGSRFELLVRDPLLRPFCPVIHGTIREDGGQSQIDLAATLWPGIRWILLAFAALVWIIVIPIATSDASNGRVAALVVGTLMSFFTVALYFYGKRIASRSAAATMRKIKDWFNE
jgi:hypothetical protein